MTEKQLKFLLVRSKSHEMKLETLLASVMASQAQAPDTILEPSQSVSGTSS